MDEAREFWEVDRLLREIAELEATSSRVAEWAAAKIHNIAEQIDVKKALIQVQARTFRTETGLSELPLANGTVTIKRRPPRRDFDKEKAEAWAIARAYDRDYRKPGPWDWQRLVREKCDFPKGRPGDAVEAFEKDTGEVLPFLVKIHPLEDDYSISITPRKETR